jgi:hypothetical protein
MSKDFFGYDKLVDDALRGVVRSTLRKVAEDGLRGPHHLYLTFRTDYPGVEIPDYLRERHPEELTIVLQHQFWALEVDEHAFSVNLSFNKAREYIGVPFAALTRFADPGAKFGLQFNTDAGDQKSGMHVVGEEPAPVDETAQKADAPEEGAEADTTGKDENDETQAENIVALDAFRKK